MAQVLAHTHTLRCSDVVASVLKAASLHAVLQALPPVIDTP